MGPWSALALNMSNMIGVGPFITLPAHGSTEGLTWQYNVWDDWTLWQYGGVDWQHGRSQPKVYSNGRYHFPTYFGNLDRPVERNVFKGSHASLVSLWQRHGIKL